MHYILGRVIVAAVTCLISFISYSSQIFIIWPWYGREWSVELLYLLVPFNVLVALVFWNYFLCVRTDPGGVPPGWRPDTHSDGYEVKKLTGTPRYCRVCQSYKPPRAHHCRECNRCVLRMDHHCPWINNCVGHFNYGHFIRFLFFVDVACSYHIFMVTKRVLAALNGEFWFEPTTTELVMMIMNYVCCVPVLLAVGGFSIYHFFNVLGNSTTIEGWEKDKVATMVRKGQILEVKFPYDLGRRRNIDAVLGNNPLLWCMSKPMHGTGLRFEMAEHAGPGIAWPPKEPEPTYRPMPESPWTYENGDVNPELVPSNARRRKGRNMDGVYNLPPYHPDFQEGASYPDDAYSEGSEDDTEEEYPHFSSNSGKVHVRRGSEGYEVRPPASREEMLRRYMEELNQVPDRYVRYVPEPHSESEDEEDEEDNVPLGSKLMSRNAAVADTTG